MALFKYVAKDIQAKKIVGKREATDRKELTLYLRTQGQFLLSCEEIDVKELNTYKLSLKELSEFARQISAMIGSGVSLIRAISIMVQREEKPKVKALLTDIYRKLQQGQSLSSAMEAQGKAFPVLMINMFKTSESTGQMEKVASIMAQQYDKEHRIKVKIRNAMIYPIILLCVTAFVIIVVFTLIIPKFSELFKSQELPAITIFVKGLSDVMLSYWYLILLGCCMLFALFTALLQVASIRFKVDRMKLKMPLFGRMLITIYTSRFARNLCSLYSSGITLLNGLAIVKGNIGNAYIESQFDEAMRKIRNGGTLSQSIQSMDGFDVKLASSIYIGEESGKLDTMLTSLADDFDYEAEAASQRMVTIMEPIMIIVLAIIVLVVMLAVLLPIYQMYQNPSGLM